MANEAGALVRVAGMFSQRGFNIESLNVAPTEDEAVSRLTLVTTGSDAVVDQINRQLLKLVDVIDVLDMTAGEHFERELLLVKLGGDGVGEALAARHGAALLDSREGIHTLRFVGDSEQVAAFLRDAGDAGVLYEVVRSGAVVVTPGSKGLRFQDSEIEGG